MKFRTRAAMVATILLCHLLPLHGQNPNTQPPPIRIGPDGVFVRVLITDQLNRYIAGLGKENFEVYEDGIRQTIQYFTQQSAPVSIGMVFDLRSRMRDQVDAAGKAMMRLLLGSPDDESFLISFDRTSATIQDFNRNSSERVDLPFGEAFLGLTQLRIAMNMGLDRIEKSKNEKKALVVVTDSVVTSTVTTIQVYAISVSPVAYSNPAPRSAGTTGVRRFVLNNRMDLEYYINLIQDELRNQYVLGYSPTNKKLDGKLRKIEVKLNRPKGMPKLVVYASRGYTAPVK